MWKEWKNVTEKRSMIKYRRMGKIKKEKGMTRNEVKEEDWNKEGVKRNRKGRSKNGEKTERK